MDQQSTSYFIEMNQKKQRKYLINFVYINMNQHKQYSTLTNIFKTSLWSF